MIPNVDGKILVTGGAGFLGSALVKRLLSMGKSVRVFDDFSRGTPRRLEKLAGDLEVVEGDIRDTNQLSAASQGVQSLFHLAAVNGTSRFYSEPERVLEVAVRGMLSVLDSVQKNQIQNLFVASSSEVYQVPPQFPTPESTPLSIPDPMNPRYSYGAGKIISEMLSLHCAPKKLNRVVIFRPHNIYGPDMGSHHVIPELLLKAHRLKESKDLPRRLEIQGTGHETRSFLYIDDCVDALILLALHGKNREIYNLGSLEEYPIKVVAAEIARLYDFDMELVHLPSPMGGVKRRCPDITKLSALGFTPQIPFRLGLQRTWKWYQENTSLFNSEPRDIP